MKVGIIGSGEVGFTLARLLAEAGHEVAIANSRGPETLEPLAAEIGPNARAVEAEGAADFGEMVIVAIPFGRYATLAASRFAGNKKIVVDATNYYPPRDGRIDLGGLTSSGWVARLLPDARLVKAFNTIEPRFLRDAARRPGPLAERLALFVAGDDEGAKAMVSGLIEDLGFGPVDTGSMAEGGRFQQPDSPIYDVPMTLGEARAALAETRNAEARESSSP